MNVLKLPESEHFDIASYGYHKNRKYVAKS